MIKTGDKNIPAIEADSEIRLLYPDDVGSLKRSWAARFSFRDLMRIAGSEPRLSLWNPRTGEYLIGELWRHRSEIACVAEIVGAASAHDLIHAFQQHAEQLGYDLILLSEYAESRKPAFYHSVGMDLIEDIVVYELDRIRPPRKRPLGLRFERLNWFDRTALDALIQLDHAAFPWLWWNSEAEFANYYESDGVAIELGWTDSSEPVAYIGTTTLRSWGHLDRIAVRPDFQGQGMGKRALDYAIAALASRGARKVALSTQARNHVSRALYDSYGFRRSAKHDYRIYGRWLTPHDGSEGRNG